MGVAQCDKTGTYSRNFHRIYYNGNKHRRINQLTKFYRHFAARCFQIQTWRWWHRERFTHGVLISGQMRETYSFGIYRSISCIFFFFFIRFHYLFLQLERGKGEPLLLLFDSVKRFLGWFIRGGSGGKKSRPACARFGRASVIKRVKRTVRQSAVSHPTPHHSPLKSSCQPASSAVYVPGR